MKKANGRLKPAEPKEVAKVTGKYFKCEHCSNEAVVPNVVFGDHIMCDKCGGEMYESIR